MAGGTPSGRLARAIPLLDWLPPYLSGDLVTGVTFVGFVETLILRPESPLCFTNAPTVARHLRDALARPGTHTLMIDASGVDHLADPAGQLLINRRNRRTAARLRAGRGAPPGGCGRSRR